MLPKPPSNTPRYAALLARRAQSGARSTPSAPLSTGLMAPFSIGINGAMSMQSEAAHVATCIRLILGTRPGERRLRPELGCALHTYFFAPNTPQTRHRIQKAIEQALEDQEPRIEDLEVQVKPDPSALERVLIQVQYRLGGAGLMSVQRFALELKQ